MKRLTIRLPAAGKNIEVHLYPGVTPLEVLSALDFPRGSILPNNYPATRFDLNLPLYDQVDDGDKLLLYPGSECLECVAAIPIAAHLRCPRMTREDKPGEPVYDRQSKVPGFSQEKMSQLKVLIAGAGALGGEIAEGLVRKGVGRLTILDFDVVQVTNLNRQFFFERDIYKNKALALVHNLQPHGYMGTELIGWPISFEQALELNVDLSCDVVVCAVDDSDTRMAISRFAAERKIPAVFSAVSEQADHGFVFIQEVGGPCFGCAFPDQVRNGRTPCPGSPAIKDTMKLMGGMCLYAIDSLFMDRPRRWTLYDLSLVDGDCNRFGKVKRRPDCPLCGGGG